MRALGKFIWRFMVIFSFIVNFVLVAVLLLAGLFIFQIKAQVADPLIGGLHSTAAGLGESTIDWVIPVRDTIDVLLEVPINSETIISPVTEIAGVPVTEQIPGETVVRLTRDVPITITGANINAGNLQLTNAIVDITLPANTELPVALDLNLALNEPLDISLDVRAVIPLSETQLNDPIRQLGLLFEPLAIGLHNLPNNFSEAGRFAGQLVSTDQPIGEFLSQSLLSTGTNEGFNAQSYDPWFGFSQTAGYDYDLVNEAYPLNARPIDTGITVPGGIPALDAQLADRQQYYDEDGETPIIFSAQSANFVDSAGVPSYTYDGSYSSYFRSQQGVFQPLSVNDVILPPLQSSQNDVDAQAVTDDTGGVPSTTTSTNTNSNASGIIPPPTPSGN